MITNFETTTSQLTKAEAKTIPHIKRLLKKGATVTSKEISAYVYERTGDNLEGTRVRKLINHMRINKLQKNILASNKGYYVSDNNKDIIRYKRSLKGRISAINEVLKSL